MPLTVRRRLYRASYVEVACPGWNTGLVVGQLGMSDVGVANPRSKSTVNGRQQVPATDALHISVIGNVAVTYRGASVGIRSRKSLAVLAYIALNEQPQETRERLVGLFWSETDEEKARASAS